MTADGNNNTGKLTIPFGAEGMDTISGGDVFNGKMNVYWQFVYGLYPARRLMWQNREAAGTWNADAYLEFATGWQNYIPERVYNQDYWYKYLRPYEQNADTQYITMLEGGKKTHQREGFVRDNLTYMASQYTGTYCTSDSITVRAYTPGVSEDMTEEEAEIIEATIEAVPPNPVVQVMLYNKGYVVVEVASVMKRVKAEKGTWYTIDFSESSSAMNDTVVNIHGASNVRAIGDMSSLYIKFCNFSKATKLRSLQIGSTETGYTNLGLTSVGFENNPMLEELYIQNCPNANTTLDLSGCQSLTTLDVRGSGFTGINFAVGGLISDAKLCSPASLTMRDLYYLTDENLSLESYNNLTTLRFENTDGVDSLDIVSTATNLSRARILGIDWSLPTTSVLNRMLTLMGLDENDHNTDVSVLTGSAYVSGSIRNQELSDYATAWPNLNVTYESENLITQYLVTYVNADDENTVLYSCYVDRGSTAPDPYYNGLISKPTIDPTAQYTFEFGTLSDGSYVEGSGWDNIVSPVLSARTVTAVYTPTIRTYTVTWYSRVGLPLETQTGQYGSCLTYSGNTPTRTDEEGSYIYNYFTGWDKSTGFITEDMNVFAVWDRTELPALGTDLKDMTRGQIFAVCTAGRAANFFEDKDYFDLTLGYNPTFSNVNELTILENRFFDGTEYYDTNIKLFDEDAPSFTLAIDYEFLNTTSNNGTLVSCYEETGNEGFRLRYSSNPDIQWGDRNVNVGYQDTRNIVVMRHQKGSRTMFVYGFNMEGSTYSMTPVSAELVRTRSTVSDAVLSFGAVGFGDGGHDYYAKGWIHWCKIWYDDLGEPVASKIASWPHDVVRMEFAGADRYRLAGSTSIRANGSFIANNLLPLNRRMNSTNTNSGGWDDCENREFMSTRLWNALDYGWQSMIKKVKIAASAGLQSSEILTSEDYLYLAAYAEVGTITSAPYINEGESISFFTNNASRVKFNGMIIPEDAVFTSTNTDPTQLSTYTPARGNVWIHTGSSSTGYYYIPATEKAKHTRIGYRAVSSTDNLSANDGGLWFRAMFWWLRSPSASNSAHFMSVLGSGSVGTSNAPSTYGVALGFSI